LICPRPIKPTYVIGRVKVLSVAVRRISEVLDAVASNPQGTTASEVASQLNLGRQAVVRLLDSMVLEGIAKKDELTKRYRLSLKTYDWGSRAVAPYLPPFYLRQELANLAREVRHPVFYCILDASDVVTLERTDALGDGSVTVPNTGRVARTHWSQSPWGKALVAFAPPDVRESLLVAANTTADAVHELTAELDSIRRQGYAERQTTADRLTMAAPILNGDGYTSGAIAIGINNYSPDLHDDFLRRLLSVATHASYDAGYSPILAH
jgi:IclR family pca regulon transcriptional regulator